MKNLSEKDLRKTIRDAQAELKKRQQTRGLLKIESPIGWWKIYTEGDCEGRSIKVIAERTYGHIGEILMKYAGSEMYALTVEALLDEEEPGVKVTTTEANVNSQGLLSQYDSILTKDQLAALQRFLGPHFTVRPGWGYAAFKVSKTP